MGLKTGIFLVLIGLGTMASVAWSQEAEEEAPPAAHVQAPPGAPGPDPVVPPPPTAVGDGPYVDND